MRGFGANGVRVALMILGVGLALYSPGCGGVVNDTSREDGPDATPGSGDVGAGLGGSTNGGRSPSGGKGGGKAGRPNGGAISYGGTVPYGGTVGYGGKPSYVCGDGIREGAEYCDGNDFGGATCSSATMGAYPTGTLGCTKSCQWDETRCVRTGGGGATGTGGTTAADACFDQNGVPGGGFGTGGTGSSCVFGQAATNICDQQAIPVTGEQCVQTCGCSACAGYYMRCSEDAYCAPILTCAMKSGCRTLTDCETSCGPLIQQAGAAGGQRIRYADSAIGCFMGSCGYPCYPPPPIGR